MSQRALICTRKGLFELHRGGAGWTIGPVHFLGDPVSMALVDARDGAMYAALNLGHFGVKLHRKEAGSDTWTEIGAPAYPPKPVDSSDTVEWKNKLIWALETGGTDQPGVLWAGTLPGGLFRSADRGDTWQLVRSLWDDPARANWFGGGYDVPGIHSICVDPRDSQHILLGVSCGGAWRTEDGGASWNASSTGMRADYMPPEMSENEAVQDPHRLARSPVNPDVVWCQHHNGIWRSENGGRDWAEVRAVPVSNFGFVVAAHPANGNTAWFVPAEADQRRVPVAAALSVTRTRDGGKTFEVLRNGLPQQHCYDLVYRHGLAVDDDGSSLLMASTSGNVWSSQDGGDSWQALAGHLPPACAVRFG